MKEILIIIEGGVVQEVKSNSPDKIKVKILDLDDTDSDESELIEQDYPYLTY